MGVAMRPTRLIIVTVLLCLAAAPLTSPAAPKLKSKALTDLTLKNGPIVEERKKIAGAKLDKTTDPTTGKSKFKKSLKFRLKASTPLKLPKRKIKMAGKFSESDLIGGTKVNKKKKLTVLKLKQDVAPNITLNNTQAILTTEIPVDVTLMLDRNKMISGFSYAMEAGASAIIQDNPEVVLSAFSGRTIPEPATVLLFGLGALGLVWAFPAGLQPRTARDTV